MHSFLFSLVDGLIFDNIWLYSRTWY